MASIVLESPPVLCLAAVEGKDVPRELYVEVLRAGGGAEGLRGLLGGGGRRGGSEDGGGGSWVLGRLGTWSSGRLCFPSWARARACANSEAVHISVRVVREGVAHVGVRRGLPMP
eukprot:3147227-Pyramimonas_sp.AAC.1